MGVLQAKYLETAVEYYLRVLLSTDTHDWSIVFRLVALWFDNHASDKVRTRLTLVRSRPVALVFVASRGCCPLSMTQVNGLIRARLDQLPPHKFLPLFYQLAARIDGSDHADAAAAAGVPPPAVPFQPLLLDLVFRCAKRFPYHTVVHVLALSNAESVRV